MNTNIISENKVIGGEFSIPISFLKKNLKCNTDTYLNKNYRISDNRQAFRV